MPFHAGDVVRVRVLHADGRCYRSWQAVVERATEDRLITLSLLGSGVYDVRGDWITDVRIRAHYWFGRLYNLLEEYGEDGALLQLYANVSTPPVITDDGFDVTDHELDVKWQPGKPAHILDEEEFAAAAELYGYTPEFQAECWETVAVLLDLVESWQPGSTPAIWPMLTEI